MLKIIIHLMDLLAGKSFVEREMNRGKKVVKNLVSSYKNSRRNISMNNFFTILSLAKHLSLWNLTIIVF